MPNSEMIKLTVAERPVMVPPVVLESYDEFRNIAKSAAVITYHPEYLISPFLDDKKRLRKVTLHAIGVMMNGIPMTFKLTLNYDELPEDLVNDVDLVMSSILSDIQHNGPIIRGFPDLGTGLREASVVRP